MEKISCKGDGTNTKCQYDDIWLCRNPDCKSVILTSTLYGSTPSGCPYYCKWNSKSKCLEDQLKGTIIN